MGNDWKDNRDEREEDGSNCEGNGGQSRGGGMDDEGRSRGGWEIIERMMGDDQEAGIWTMRGDREEDGK